MSEEKKTRPVVPEGKSRYLVTRQMQANEKGFVGYETVWEPFHKEVKYETPKRPWFDPVVLIRHDPCELKKRVMKNGEE